MMGAIPATSFACMGARELQAGLAAREFSAREVAEASLERIASLDGKVHAFVETTEQLALEGYRYFLMEDEGRAVGYCGVQPRDGRLFLSKVYLLHEARGQGRFRQMLEYLRGLCREVGARTIWLTVNRRNERAIGAYRRAGFREVRAQVTDIGGGYVMDDYVMELETTPQKE